MRRTSILTLALAMAFAVAPAQATRTAPPAALPAAPFDARSDDAPVLPTAAQLNAARALRRATPGVRIEWNRRFGTPSSILRHGATLTGQNASPDRAAREWLTTHAAMFGWDAAGVAKLETIKTLSQPGGGPRTVLLHQTFGGLHGGSFGGSVTVSTDKDHRVLSVRANVVRVPAIAGSPRLNAAAATAIAGGLAAAPKVLGTVNGWTHLGATALAGRHFAKLSAFPSGDAATRPVFEVFFSEAEERVYHVAVDAITGDVLRRDQIVADYAPEGRVFQNYPGAERGGTHEIASFKGDFDASPAGWLSPVSSTRKLPTTIGNNATTATHWVAGQAPDGPGELRPVAPNYIFDEPFTDAWNTSNCGRVADTANAQPTYAQDSMPAVVNLFYHHNLMHDYFWSLGFTAEAGAMQANNFGRAGLAGDPLIGLVQAGAAVSRNNAYMATLPDGLPSYSGMYLWQPPAPGRNPPCVDGSFDAHVIYHEYAHAVTNRWVGGEWGNLSGAQGGAMGEAWGDFYGLHYLHMKGLEKGFMVGAYATGDREHGIRNWALNETAARYGDFGYNGGPAVHSDGEIWSGALWDLRTTLGRAIGSAEGATYAAQIIADAMPTSGPAPTMLNMRDAILLADVARTGGRHQALLWEVFARRGMGASAAAAGASDASPKAAYDALDPMQNGRITLRVVDPESGKPVPGAQVLGGTLEASVPLAETDGSGAVSFLMAGGPHILTVRVAGYGSRSVVVRVQPAKRVVTTVSFAPNYASGALGATAASADEAANVSALIDDSKHTTAAIKAGDEGAVTIKLAGTAPVVVREVRLAAGPGTGALDEFQVLSSRDGTTFAPLVAGRLGRSTPEFRVGFEDRMLRSWTVTPTLATHLRLIARTPQITGSTITVADVQAFGSGDRYAIQSTAPLKLRDEGSMVVALPLTPDVAEIASPSMAAMSLDCGIPPTQGVDTWVTEVEPSFAGARMRAEAPDFGGAGALPEFDVYFLDAGCHALAFAAAADPMPVEEGVIPAGTKYIVVLHFAGPPTDVTITAEAPGRKLTRIGGPNPARRR